MRVLAGEYEREREKFPELPPDRVDGGAAIWYKNMIPCGQRISNC
jgi:hypothetical protein